MKIEEGKHYYIKYDPDGNILAMGCAYCDFCVTFLHCRRTKTGHRWPFMVHKIKRHLRDEHDINLYKKIKEKL